jgi:hypothetical protein
METEGSLPCSQKSATGRFAEPDETMLLTLTVFSQTHPIFLPVCA